LTFKTVAARCVSPFFAIKLLCVFAATTHKLFYGDGRQG
jgi:hypothetical protein